MSVAKDIALFKGVATGLKYSIGPADRTTHRRFSATGNRVKQKTLTY